MQTTSPSLNALKHGMMAAAAVIRTGENREDETELDQFAAGLRVRLHPDGELEDLLFDQIVASAWRWRRAIRYESGVITSRTAAALSQFHYQESHRDENAFYGVSVTPTIRDIDRELEGIGADLAALDAMTPLPDTVSPSPEGKGPGVRSQLPSPELIQHAIGVAAEKFGTSVNRLLKLKGAWRSRRDFTPEQLQTVVADACERGHVSRRQFWAAVRPDIENKRDSIAAEIAAREQRRYRAVSAAGMPDHQNMRKLQRYEAHLSRQFYRALHELRSLQSTNGHPSPTPSPVHASPRPELGEGPGVRAVSPSLAGKGLGVRSRLPSPPEGEGPGMRGNAPRKRGNTFAGGWSKPAATPPPSPFPRGEGAGG